jgi:transposase
MPNFIQYDYNQNAMVVINFLDQLKAGTFEHAIHHLVENEIDLSVYFPVYKNEHNGRPAYDPAILLKIILFAYSKGITSSREIEWNCKTNIIFKALSCDTVPHNTTIASFISGHPQSVESIFEQILLTCNQQGLLGHELFAIDGCKMSSDASKEWSGKSKAEVKSNITDNQSAKMTCNCSCVARIPSIHGHKNQQRHYSGL